MDTPLKTPAQTPEAEQVACRVGSRASRPHLPLRSAFLIFVVFNCVFALTSTGRVRVEDEYMTLFEAQSLLQRGSFTVPQAVRLGNFYGKYDRRGQPRAPYPPGHALAAAPWYTLGQYVLVRLPGVPQSAADLVLGFAVTLSSATFAGATVALAFLLFCGIGIAERPALLAAAMLGFATPVFAYSGWFFSEPLSCALLMGAAFALFARSAEEAIPFGPAIIAGLLLGCAVLVRATHVLAAAVFFLAILARQGKRGVRSAIFYGIGVTAGVATLLAYNFRNFGRVFDFGYPATAEGGKALNTFHTPLTTGLNGFLLSPGKSIFVFAPPIILAIYGLRKLWGRDHGLGVMVAGVPLLYLSFFSKYTQWEGGYCFGPRYLVPAIALLCLALGPALAEAGRGTRILAGVLFAAGSIVQCLGLSTSFLEAAVGGGYYDAHWNYQLGYSALSRQATLFAHYVASSAPAPLGQGFDRWFVFLYKGGVAPGTLAAIAAAFFLIGAAAAWRLRREVERSEHSRICRAAARDPQERRC